MLLLFQEPDSVSPLTTNSSSMLVVAHEDFADQLIKLVNDIAKHTPDFITLRRVSNYDELWQFLRQYYYISDEIFEIDDERVSSLMRISRIEHLAIEAGDIKPKSSRFGFITTASEHRAQLIVQTLIKMFHVQPRFYYGSVPEQYSHSSQLDQIGELPYVRMYRES